VSVFGFAIGHVVADFELGFFPFREAAAGE